jgi:predicted PurR-regulated permease PerM
MPQQLHIHFSVKSIILLLAAAALIWLVANFSGVLVILFIAILLAVAISPLVDGLEARRVPRVLAIVLSYLGLLGIVSLAVGVLVPVVVDESAQLSTSLPRLAQSALELPERWLPSFFQTLQLNDLVQRLSDQLGGVIGSAGALLLGFGQTLTTIILNGLLVLVVGFILTSDAQFAPRFIARFFPPSYRPMAAQLAREIGRRLGHWVRAQLLVCLFYGVCFGLGLGLIGVPYAFALGLAAAFMELIPYIGGLIVTALAVLIALSVSPWLALGVVVLYLVVSNIEANILYPKVVGDIVGLHPLVIIVALFVGAEARGVMGALLAVPAAVVIQVLFDQFYRFEEPAGALAEVPKIEPPAQPAASPALRKS